jgi:hypothetical protein
VTPAVRHDAVPFANGCIPNQECLLFGGLPAVMCDFMSILSYVNCNSKFSRTEAYSLMAKAIHEVFASRQKQRQ